MLLMFVLWFHGIVNNKAAYFKNGDEASYTYLLSQFEINIK